MLVQDLRCRSHCGQHGHGHTGFSGLSCFWVVARKECMCTWQVKVQSSSMGNEWLQLERIVGAKVLVPHFSCKSKVVSCTFHRPTGYRSHQKLHVFERMIFKIFGSLDLLIYIFTTWPEMCSLASNGLNVQLYCPSPTDVARQSLKVV